MNEYALHTYSGGNIAKTKTNIYIYIYIYLYNDNLEGTTDMLWHNSSKELTSIYST
jgi:hypothetical protein